MELLYTRSKQLGTRLEATTKAQVTMIYHKVEYDPTSRHDRALRYMTKSLCKAPFGSGPRTPGDDRQ